MGSFILFILIAFILFIGLGVLFVYRFVRMLLKGPKVSPFGNNYNNDQSHNQHKNTRYRNSHNQEHHDHEKVFSKDEGEYVDYEEIK